jgi:hypothetical protein
MFFATVPKELLLIIRSYLVVFNIIEENVEELEIFVQEESGRSWRNFLATSNNQNWKTMRKETRIWSLNGKSFRKYLMNDLFRQYVNDRMANPAHQLHCRSFGGAKELPLLNSLLAEMVGASNIACINIRAYSFPKFPSSRSLLSLNIGLSGSLEQLGDFPNLEILQFWKCPGLTTVGRMDNLKELHLKSIDKSVNENVVSQFPLEQLEKLVVIGRTVKEFPKFAHRLKSLRDLNLSVRTFSTYHYTFSAQEYPFLTSLIKLHLEYFNEVDLTGLTNLKHLSIMGGLARPIVGRDEIYPNLKSFSFFSSEEENMDFYETKLINVSDCTFFDPSRGNKPIVIPDQIQSLCLVFYQKGSLICSSNRSFHKVIVSSCSLYDYSMFSNVQILYLQDCRTLTDLTPFQNIPYLQLDNLSKVKSFSCLCNQKYLKISKCEGLTDEAVSHFGNIFHLHIFDCSSITVIKGLTYNRFIIIESNYNLEEIYLSGKDYILVSVKHNWRPVEVHLTGRVYSLEVTDTENCIVEDLKRNSSYLNGEENSSCFEESPNLGTEIERL